MFPLRELATEPVHLPRMEKTRHAWPMTMPLDLAEHFHNVLSAKSAGSENSGARRPERHIEAQQASRSSPNRYTKLGGEWGQVHFWQ